jgi:hypothetical protein
VPITFTDRDTGDGPCIEVTRGGRVHGEIRRNPLDQGPEDADLDALKAAVTRYGMATRWSLRGASPFG